MRHGELTEAEAAVHPHRHILTRALGVSPDVDVDLWELHLHDGDRILLCSDGLTNEVGDRADRRQSWRREPDPSRRPGRWSRRPTTTAATTTSPCVVVDVLVGDDEVAVPRQPWRAVGRRRSTRRPSGCGADATGWPRRGSAVATGAAADRQAASRPGAQGSRPSGAATP